MQTPEIGGESLLSRRCAPVVRTVDRYAVAPTLHAVNAVEFTTELSGAMVLPIPVEVAAQLPKTGRARIIVLTDEQAGAYQQFFRNDSEGDVERAEWAALGARSLARAYGDDEPEYSLADLKP